MSEPEDKLQGCLAHEESLGRIETRRIICGADCREAFGVRGLPALFFGKNHAEKSKAREGRALQTLRAVR